jgi:hypothetical protein
LGVTARVQPEHQHERQWDEDSLSTVLHTWLRFDFMVRALGAVVVVAALVQPAAADEPQTDKPDAKYFTCSSGCRRSVRTSSIRT